MGPVICEDHFQDGAMMKTAKGKRLKRDAIPVFIKASRLGPEENIYMISKEGEFNQIFSSEYYQRASISMYTQSLKGGNYRIFNV